MRRGPLIVLPLISAVLLVALILAIVLSGSAGSPSPRPLSASPPTFDGAELPTKPPAPDFTLVDQVGRHVALSSFRGRVVVLSFLYSTCGASCVVIAQQIRGALDELGKAVPVLIVSVDPSADTPTHVRDFLKEVSLSGRVEYLSGSLSSLRAIWRKYRIVPASAGRNAFDRYASLLVLDRSGRERVLFQTEVLTPESLAHDIGTLEGG